MRARKFKKKHRNSRIKTDVLILMCKFFKQQNPSQQQMSVYRDESLQGALARSATKVDEVRQGRARNAGSIEIPIGSVSAVRERNRKRRREVLEDCVFYFVFCFGQRTAC